MILSRSGHSGGDESGFDQRSGTTNGVLSTPGYLLALLRDLSHVPRGLTENDETKKVRKSNQTDILYQIVFFQKSTLRCGSPNANPKLCTVLLTSRFVSTTKIWMKCVVNWIPLRIRVRSRNTQPHLKHYTLC